MVSLTSCQIESRFQDARNVTHVSVVASMSLGLNSLSPLFLTVSDVTFKDAESRQLQDEFYAFRTPRNCMTTSARRFSFGMSLYLTSIFCEPVSLIKI
jgi:hypothetical protein